MWGSLTGRRRVRWAAAAGGAAVKAWALAGPKTEITSNVERGFLRGLELVAGALRRGSEALCCAPPAAAAAAAARGPARGEALFPAWSANVVGLALEVEGFNIVRGWQSVQETIDDELKGEFGNVGLRSDYVNGEGL
jgi:hypothetical protein